MIDESKETRSIWERLQTLDSRMLRIILIILVAVPYLRPLGLPLTISQQVIDFHKTFEELTPGSTILFEASFGPNTYNILSGIDALLTYIAEEYPASHDGGKLKILILAGDPQVPIAYDEKIQPAFEKANLKYGVDYIFLGYFTGLESYVAALAENIPNVISTDYYGESIDKFPIMEGIVDHTDINLVLTVCAAANPDYYVKHWAMRGTEVVSMAPAVYFLKWNTYYLQGNLKGLVGSAVAAGEYEVIVGLPGIAVAKSDTISVSLLYLIILVILANLGFIGQKYLSKNGGNS